jgi:hypothetical protein
VVYPVPVKAGWTLLLLVLAIVAHVVLTRDPRIIFVNNDEQGKKEMFKKLNFPF